MLLSLVAIVFIVTAGVIIALLGIALYNPCKNKDHKPSTSPLMEHIYP
jgi:hypothetical protein